jgi:dTDP-4-amino-4,6-dideoxygalactose transaminase
VAERLAGEILSLPMFPELEPVEIERVADAIRSFDAGGNAQDER